MIFPSTDMGAQIICDEGFAKPQALTDATFITGAIIDTQPAGAEGYRSGTAIFIVAFTTASGGAGNTEVATISVYHDTASNMATEAVLKTDTYTYTWAADGANSGIHLLPFSLETANRYIRVKAKITETGLTMSNGIGAIGVALGGMTTAPDSGFAATGYETTVEAS